MSPQSVPSFVFETTRSIVSEPGACTRLGQIMRDLGATRVLVVTDPGVRKFGLTDAALESLTAAGLEPVIFDRVVADPPAEVVETAAAEARDAGVDGVVGLGGGSSMDVAKLVAFLVATPVALDTIYGVGNAKGRRLPLVQIPTTAGTGSEVTPISIVTTGAAEKKGVVSPLLLPDVALLDADLTLGLPKNVTAATGVDAMVHAIEAYTSAHKKNPLSDVLAREALRLLGGAIRRACTDGRDRAARADMMLGALLAGQAFANAPVAAVHALAYPLGGHFHVPHGLSNSLVLPHVLRFNLESETAARAYGELAPIVFPDLDRAGGDKAVSARFADALAGLTEELGLETRLAQVGVGHNHLPLLAEDAMKQTRLLVNNPREVTLDDARAIYEAAL
ncbi:iron-containing alcohol dehydrogenase [Tistrella mobilis]|uniref:Alcohol dehydrogenase 2 n=2 Tax=Tistrella mobilis TaxID=171437 RepID=I3THZ8_TISMK|nr:iron-containing alcohol dehydrogenase [Tistrella mobilis]AFK52386.1 putative iron-containing alcohol dehydrogenase [Tistrella mobilis KA081020-065]KYO50113.1 alcohol dehydrogenase [Tistrella mobilis]